VTDELRLYWTLHEIDEQAVAHEAALVRQPAARRQHESAVAAARKAIQTLDRRSADALKARRAAEGEIAAIEAMERKFDSQLTAVTNQHQFEAVQHQLAAARAKRSDFETVALEQLDVEERLAAEIRAAVDDATSYAESQPDPSPSTAMKWVYAEEWPSEVPPPWGLGAADGDAESH